MPSATKFLVNQTTLNVQNAARRGYGRQRRFRRHLDQLRPGRRPRRRLWPPLHPAGPAGENEFQVNTTVKHSQETSAVSMDQNGDFVVVWLSDQQDGSTFGVYGQRFNAAGTKLGGEFAVNTYTLDKQTQPSVAMDAAGDFVVAWSSFGQDGSGYGVYARRYNAAGTAQSNQEFLVNQTTQAGRLRPTWEWPRTADS